LFTEKLTFEEPDPPVVQIDLPFGGEEQKNDPEEG
jgi:hypothetical protein